jgi:hypothetical protein
MPHLPTDVAVRHWSAHHGRVSQPQPERDDVEDWRLLQEVLEERDREWWAEAEPDEEG